MFLIVFPLFLLFAFRTLFHYVMQKEISTRELLYITVTGAYFAISYGCGMSAGLAEGQATIGVAFVIAFILYSFDFRYGKIIKACVVFICFFITIQSAEKKMLYTYSWWGMDESDLWSSGFTSDDIELLSGICMSPETLNAYETIYHVITTNTDENDSIYCFPQIPVFYSICDRSDPGVRAKVQWFDVASDASIDADINVIKSNPPKAILIYETSEYAYQSHEKMFRDGNISATRVMKNFLIDFAQTHGYVFYGRISSTDNNNFLLYYKENNDYSLCNDFEGEGSFEAPYLINSVDDLLQLSKRVENGNDFAGNYFRQETDLDLSEIDNWEPIGKFRSGFYFRGVYDGGGHVISNLHCEGNGDGCVGLFGQLGGIVCNLGVIESDIRGTCVGVIASHSVGENAMIINCYTDSYAEGKSRAGGIADNFNGIICNCFSVGKTYGMEMAGAVSYTAGMVENVFALNDSVISGIVGNSGNGDVIYCTRAYIESENLLGILNGMVSGINQCRFHYQQSGLPYDEETGRMYADWMGEVELKSWEFNNKQYYPVLQ